MQALDNPQHASFVARATELQILLVNGCCKRIDWKHVKVTVQNHSSGARLRSNC